MSIYDSLNNKQQEAVFLTEGPLLILAGAGSGKTRVLTHRIAYLIEEKSVNPWNILAITFTNKAAGEMRERVDNLIGFGAESVWVSTFHSMCVRILRRYADRIGYTNSFTIYDTDDQKTVMKEVCKKLQIDTKNLKEKAILGKISACKDELIGAEQFLKETQNDFGMKKIAMAYSEYQKQLKSNNAMDFDDLIFKTVELFRMNPDVLESYQERFKYIMVDEYQDTNTAQFKLISLLAGKYRNLCVVGDDDQSIYGFRGANINNILDFEKIFNDAHVIKLEQNYRSTQNILDAANQVISNNYGRKSKTLWTDNGEGEKINFTAYNTGFDEANGIVSDIKTKVEERKYDYRDIAILYRTNAQSRALEEKFVQNNIPYRVFGGVNFYARKEIKDILAYLKTIDNATDDVAVKRIINVPKRGIGQTTIDRVSIYADENEISFYDALRDARNISTISKGASKIEPFTNMIQMLRSKASVYSVTELVEDVVEDTGYIQYLKDTETEDEVEQSVENINELITKAKNYDDTAEEPTLSGFLEEVALVADIDNLDENTNRVVLMTLHSAKGLEYPVVYLAGLEDGLFPSYMTITSEDPNALEEERRLAYVGITRAMKELNLSAAKQRMIRGETQYNKVSRFVKEIPRNLLKVDGKETSERRVSKENRVIKDESVFKRNTPVRTPVRTNYSSLSSSNIFDKTPSGNKATLSYGIGDNVKHIKFGIGKVVDIKDGGRDYEVTVDFDTAGTKKMFASFAKLVKC
ncbi:DNA helicase PcrA [Falcatimonas sp. MSJ-15]|uniref:DNA helicase PcrA n=1 Tax=Falcatimonas sp. MSJ-15 TaxID=2841515 RepID=UPI001C123FDA|nr:DNA helicase PcrA [Falcatimonas sp. MSJ-15]MBU5470609.1 DNA helicase PcrA [Falcatimonas sp. MSJ-15]